MRFPRFIIFGCVFTIFLFISSFNFHQGLAATETAENNEYVPISLIEKKIEEEKKAMEQPET